MAFHPGSFIERVRQSPRWVVGQKGVDLTKMLMGKLRQNELQQIEMFEGWCQCLKLILSWLKTNQNQCDKLETMPCGVDGTVWMAALQIKLSRAKCPRWKACHAATRTHPTCPPQVRVMCLVGHKKVSETGHDTRSFCLLHHVSMYHLWRAGSCCQAIREADDHAKGLCNLQPQLLALKIAQDPWSLSKDSPIFAPWGPGPFGDWSHVGASLICDEASLEGLEVLPQIMESQPKLVVSSERRTDDQL